VIDLCREQAPRSLSAKASTDRRALSEASRSRLGCDYWQGIEFAKAGAGAVLDQLVAPPPPCSERSGAVVCYLAPIRELAGGFVIAEQAGESRRHPTTAGPPAARGHPTL